MLLLKTIYVILLLQTTAADNEYDEDEYGNTTPRKSVHRIGESEDISELVPEMEDPNTLSMELEPILRTNTSEEGTNSTTVENQDLSGNNSLDLGDMSGIPNVIVPTVTKEPPANHSPDSQISDSAALDVPALINLIMNLTSDIESNLTNKLNESLQRMSLPTCGTIPTVPTTTSEYDANYTGSIVAKCFVCGLEIHGVPAHAHCADAFAGDFLPLVPVDPTAKSKISRYRKYCKYQNIPGFAYNSSDTRSIFGRWTGGCAVRWTDMSGIYTQRTCRSRLAPSVGRHYGSKRMAKLEKALWMVDNGCIVSPMATLLPLSRGISLYARFHACVCTGSWCNRAPPPLHPSLTPALLAMICKLFLIFLS